jgi:alkylation response protein AidB-like acyl-CoA dehydrogenase
MHLPEDAIKTLGDHAETADAEAVFPEVSWHVLVRAGVLGWSIPVVFGGKEGDVHELLRGHETLAGACLTTAFLLSQREAAVRRLCDCDNETLREALLPRLAAGETFATVGLSQLTTSRQHQSPALSARRVGAEWIFNGVMPWVTGAERADYLVTGAVTEDARQLLAVVPRGLPGLTVGPPLDLMALRGSLTAEVRCDEVRVGRKWLLAGPAEKVLVAGRGGTGGLETSCLALGLAGAAIDYLAAEAEKRSELMAGWKSLEAARQHLRKNLHALADSEKSPQATAELRSRANRLVLGATQAALTAAKGVGFLRSHSAQRWARQALFFLVWSCPRPAAEATLQHLTHIDQGA